VDTQDEEEVEEGVEIVSNVENPEVETISPESEN
jgi:hypothetical protein